MITWDTVNKGAGVTLSSGNLTASIPNNSSGTALSSEGKSNGKWYCEITISSSGNATLIGATSNNTGTSPTASNARYYYGYNGTANSTGTSGNLNYGASYGTGDIISIALDMDNGTIEFWKNGIKYGISSRDVKTLGTVYIGVWSGGSSASVNCTANFGATPFKYSIPDGYSPYDFESSKSWNSINKILLLSNSKTYSLKPMSEVRYETKMTSNTSPAPFVVSASSQFSTSQQPFNAFNGVKDDIVWLTTEGGHVNSWIQIDFGDKRPVNKVSLTPRSTGNINQTPKDFYIESSIDGVNWLRVGDFTVTDWIQFTSKEFSLKYSVARYFRITHLTTNGATRASWSEIQYSYENIVTEIPNNSVHNFINYGVSSPVQINDVFSSKNYILQDTVSEDANGHWTTKIDRKPLSIKFD